MAEELRRANVALQQRVEHQMSRPLAVAMPPQAEESRTSLNADSISSAITASKKKEHETAQPTVVAKLQAVAGIIPKTATPAALLLVVGLGLLVLAWFFRSRRNSVRHDIVKG